MERDDDETPPDNDSRNFTDALSGFPETSIEENLGSETRTMNNNNEVRTLTSATAGVTERMLAQRVHDGRSIDMSVATEIIQGVIQGYRGVTSMTRFEVAWKLPEIIEGIIVDELSRLIYAPTGTRLTWQAAAELVNSPRSTLYDRFGDKVYYPKA